MAVEFLEILTAYTGLSPTTLFTVLAAGIAVYFIVSVLFAGSSHHHQQHTSVSSDDDISRSMASSSSSSSQSWKHEVFLSFRGEDTRNNFVDHLYMALVQRGIQTYKDDKTLDRGESIGPTLLKAIQESRIAVVVFSENYADSSWCLDELAHIMECMDTRGQIVMPIFYHVDPSDVRKLKRKYEEAFSKHEVGNNHKVESWRKALEKAGSISGWAITENTHEAICVKEIVCTISNKLRPLITNINKDLIGIETRLRDLKSKLEIGSDGVRIVGIWGIGGGGKTTLASAAYAEISHLFEGHCLLQNIREETKIHGLKKLQDDLLSLVLKTRDVNVGSELVGRSMIESNLRNKRVLVVLDDVDAREQLKALAGSRAWFGEGSRIIITTRNQHLLSTCHEDEVYEVSLLSHDEAIELFNKHAYRKDKPIEDYEMLSKDVVFYADGLPLALEILGSFLYDKDKDEWKSALAKLKCIPNVEVIERLKISYDGLEPDQQTLFLDIACYWRRMRRIKRRRRRMRRTYDLYEAKEVFDACDLHPDIGIKVLVQKSLIKVVDYEFDMHDLIEEMAHNIVRGEHPKNPEKHNRIWKKEDIEYLCDMGTNAPPMDNEVIYGLWTYTKHPGLSDVVAKMKKLRWIQFANYPASSFPSNFQPTKLGYLKLYDSQQKELWHGYKLLPNLKILKLVDYKKLIKTPDFDGLPCLERLILNWCESLEEIHPSIGYHKRLVFVDMRRCEALKRFPPIIQMKKLETLDLGFCSELQEFPDIQSNMDSLVTLDLSHTSIEIIPPSVGRFCTNLVALNLSGCENLKRIKGNLHLLKSLKDLYLSDVNFHQDRLMSLMLPQFPRLLRTLHLGNCNLRDGDIPYDICELLNLQILDLSSNRFSRLPSGISRLPCLKYLDLSYCKSLVELTDLPSSIAILYANWCDSLERVGDLSDYKWLWKVSLWGCNKLIGGGERVLLSMVEGNVVVDRFMSVSVSPIFEESSIFRGTFILQLPHNWYSDFSGFLLVLRAEEHSLSHKIVIKQEMSLTHSEKFDKDWERYPYKSVGYVPFSSLRHIPWLNPTYTKNLSFYADDDDDDDADYTVLSVSLVRSNRKVGDLNERPIDYSECWGEEYEAWKTFEIFYSESS